MNLRPENMSKGTSFFLFVCVHTSTINHGKAKRANNNLYYFNKIIHRKYDNFIPYFTFLIAIYINNKNSQFVF